MGDNHQAAMQIVIAGELINIEQDFFDQYPESMLAKWKAQQRELGKENDRVEIDRSARYFKKILEFIRDKKAIRFYLMSHIELKKLRNDAAFFGIEDLVERCEKELKIMRQSLIPTVTDQESLNLLLADETRLVIIVDSGCRYNEEVLRACELLNRDKCLIISRQGSIESLSCFDERMSTKFHNYTLYDPTDRKILLTGQYEGDLLAMIYHAETLTRLALGCRDELDAICVQALDL